MKKILVFLIITIFIFSGCLNIYALEHGNTELSLKAYKATKDQQALGSTTYTWYEKGLEISSGVALGECDYVYVDIYAENIINSLGVDLEIKFDNSTFEVVNDESTEKPFRIGTSQAGYIVGLSEREGINELRDGNLIKYVTGTDAEITEDNMPIGYIIYKVLDNAQNGTSKITLKTAKMGWSEDGVINDYNVNKSNLTVQIGEDIVDTHESKINNSTNSNSTEYSSTQEKRETTKVSTKGGNFEFLDGELVVNVEKNTFEHNIEISVQEIDEDIPSLPTQTETTKLKLAGKVYDFDAEGKTFNKPVEITLSYDEDLVDNATRLGVYVYNEDTNKWDYVGGKVDKDNGTVTVTLNHFSKYAVMEYDRTFTDVSSHWAKEDIELMAARHIANGMTTTTFAPQGKITRAQFATLLVRALGLEISENDNSFTDVNDEWFAGYVTTAYDVGLVNGKSTNKFEPVANITREQMAAMIMRAYANKTNNDYNNIATSTEERFNDESYISTWAYHAVLIANDLSIINGMGDNMFAPKKDATRAQAIVMIKRLLEVTESL